MGRVLTRLHAVFQRYRAFPCTNRALFEYHQTYIVPFLHGPFVYQKMKKRETNSNRERDNKTTQRLKFCVIPFVAKVLLLVLDFIH